MCMHWKRLEIIKRQFSVHASLKDKMKAECFELGGGGCQSLVERLTAFAHTCCYLMRRISLCSHKPAWPHPGAYSQTVGHHWGFLKNKNLNCRVDELNPEKALLHPLLRFRLSHTQMLCCVTSQRVKRGSRRISPTAERSPSKSIYTLSQRGL